MRTYLPINNDIVSLISRAPLNRIVIPASYAKFSLAHILYAQ
jgi:hypothetical protein